MQQLLCRFTFIFFLTFSLSTNVFSQDIQEEDIYYRLAFETMDQQAVKPLIVSLMPIFKEVPHFALGQYNIFYYKVQEVVEIESLEAALASTEFIFIGFKEISQEAYLKVVK
jgi:hypothetical protein